MENSSRNRLVEVAIRNAKLPYHGYLEGQDTNITPIIALFPKWNVKAADGYWCAAFVYYCCIEAGFQFPYSPDECETCSLAGCGGWEEFTMKNPNIEYHKRSEDFQPMPGDIVIYDKVFENQEHDHIGIIVKVNKKSIVAAEGNINHTNTSGLIRRKIDKHIRAYVRIPDGYKY